MSTVAKHKAVTTWLALLAGIFGAHRFYLYGLKDRWGWAFPLLAVPGLIGVQRMNTLGQDDRVAWLLIPLLGISLVAALLGGIVYGLMPDERWNERFNGGRHASTGGWAAVIGVVLCLFVGGIALMSTIAFSAQRYFESQVAQ
jgi:hypothetical protein